MNVPKNAYFAIIICMLLLAGPIQSRVIDTFRFDYTPSAVSRPVVGARGEIWLTSGNPNRLYRILEGELTCVYDADSELGGAPDITISPDGTVCIGNCKYFYLDDDSITLSNIEQPSNGLYQPARFDADMKIFCVVEAAHPYSQPYFSFHLWEMGGSLGTRKLMDLSGCPAGDTLFISINECWVALFEDWTRECMLQNMDLETGEVLGSFNMSAAPDASGFGLWARDSSGRTWLATPGIGSFDGVNFTTFAAGNYESEFYRTVTLASDGAVWSNSWTISSPSGVVCFRGGADVEYTTEEGLLSDRSLYPPLIDYDGNIWIASWEGLSCISDGGWPPMRLMLREVATEGTISVEAQVINNGPVVGVDVYIALQLNGQLLYWPNWTSEPHANQVNLRPGHNQTATIIEMPREQVPPGSYTFWGCMTGRNTQKLIGPIDRKFESVQVVR
ncbi:MAG: hypothetical protein JW941_04090 [Candidatus Coatesbacteria bacterium]|nr:hypothetical protein [Candidatus Coatesbacteria bacterium]